MQMHGPIGSDRVTIDDALISCQVFAFLAQSVIRSITAIQSDAI